MAESRALADQDYVGRVDGFAGFMYLDSPSINLAERGFHTQAGLRVNRWMSLGFDFSTESGHTTLTPNMLTNSLKQQLGGQLLQLVQAGLIPPTYVLAVPINSQTETYAAGPQFSYRRWNAITPFIRPAFGAIHETATPKPGDPIAAGIVARLAPRGKKDDWVGFYGFGGGLDVNVTHHFGFRVQADYVRDHLFNDLLNWRNTYRLSVGPTVQFGRNVGR